MTFKKNIRIKICSLLNADRTATCDENWILYDNHKLSGQWFDCDESPKPKVAIAKDYGDIFMVCNWCYPLNIFIKQIRALLHSIK